MNELLRKIIEDENVTVKTVEQLEREYELELQKPFEERDFDLLGEIAQTIDELQGGESNSAPMDKLNERIDTSVRKRKSRNKGLITLLCVILVIILPANIASQKVYGMNVFSAVVSFFNGNLFVDYDVIELPVSESDPYGLKAECEKNGMDVILPAYIPNGFRLVFNGFEETEEVKSIDFHYRNGKQKLYINIKQHKIEIPDKIFFPSGTRNLQELSIGDRLTFILKEKDGYTVTFENDFAVYYITTQGIDYGELMGILYSFE